MVYDRVEHVDIEGVTGVSVVGDKRGSAVKE
jgi:hypothetical protein